MDKEEEKILGCIGGVAVLAGIPLVSIFEGFCLSIMWTWFIVPLGIQKIGTAHAIGITTVMAILAHQVTPNNKKDDPNTPVKNMAVIICTAIARVAMQFIIGWIASKFM